MFPGMSQLSLMPNPEAMPVSPTVLIVSKEDDTRFLFEMLLCGLDCDVLSAEDIKICAELIKRSPPQMILLDAQFPFREDITSLLELRQNEEFDKIPIVLISNYPSKCFEELNRSLKVRDHLIKSVNFTRLEDCLKNNIPAYSSSYI